MNSVLLLWEKRFNNPKLAKYTWEAYPKCSCTLHHHRCDVPWTPNVLWGFSGKKKGGPGKTVLLCGNGENASGKSYSLRLARDKVKWSWWWHFLIKRDELHCLSTFKFKFQVSKIAWSLKTSLAVSHWFKPGPRFSTKFCLFDPSWVLIW